MQQDKPVFSEFLSGQKSRSVNLSKPQKSNISELQSVSSEKPQYFDDEEVQSVSSEKLQPARTTNTRKPHGMAVNDEIMVRLRVMAAKTHRKIYELANEALDQYLTDHGE
jgi:hypothetical protein